MDKKLVQNGLDEVIEITEEERKFKDACEFIKQSIIDTVQGKPLQNIEVCYEMLADIREFDEMEYKKRVKQIAGILEQSADEIDKLVKRKFFHPLQYSDEALQDIGIFVGDDFSKVKVNANMFIPYLINKRILLIVRNEYGNFYNYIGGNWQEVRELEIQKLIRDEMERIQPYIWTSKIGNECVKVLKLIVPSTMQMKSSINRLNTKNALIDLCTMKVSKHMSAYFTTTQLPVIYNKNKECPRFIEFLKSIFPNNEKYVDLIQEIMGYCLWDGTEAEKIFIFYGVGANGKSVLCYIIQKLIGESNCSTLSLNDMSQRFGKEHIVGKKVNIATENDLILTKSSVNTQFLKSVSSGEEIYVEQKGKDMIQHIATTKMLFSLNNMPKVEDTSDAFYRRLVILPFEQKFSLNPKNDMEKQANVHLKHELLEELEGILNFALEGLVKLKENNFQFTIPEESENFLEEYKIDNNHIAEFLDEIDIANVSGARINQDIIFESYLRWAEKANYRKTFSKRRAFKEMKKELQRRGIQVNTKPSNNKTYWEDITCNIQVAS